MAKLSHLKNDRRQTELMLVLPRCTQHVRVAEMAARIEIGEHVDREVLVEIAQCYSQCCSRLGRFPVTSPSTSIDTLGALQKAISQGFKDVVILETDPDLDAITPPSRP